MHFTNGEGGACFFDLWRDTIELAKSSGEDEKEFVDEILSSVNDISNSIVIEFLKEKNFYALPHFPYGYIPHNNGNENQSISQKWKESMIEEIHNAKVPDNYNLMCIYGEFSDIDTVKFALESDFSADIIFGPKLLKNKYKGDIVNLLNDYTDNIKLWKCEYRPEQHAVFIGHKHLLLESKHSPGRFYNYAYIIEDISDQGRELIMTEYNRLIPSTIKGTENVINSMELYPVGNEGLAESA